VTYHHDGSGPRFIAISKFSIVKEKSELDLMEGPFTNFIPAVFVFSGENFEMANLSAFLLS
jgi:hypothetical protein